MPRPSLLTSLLPSTSYLLAYVLPLLFLSLTLTFAGAFLTLDRTRSFAPSYDTLPKQRKTRWTVEGGVGGLAVGYVFGIHVSSFLALLIPAISTSSALTPKSFFPIWLSSAIVTTLVSGRWKYCALAFSGISGGALVALSLCVIVHPSLITRIVLTAIILPILPAMTLLPLVRFQHATLRFAMSVTGAFGVVLSIALLSHVQAWANVWERYWESDGLTWGTSKEKGLTAVLCLFCCAGMACDWLLRRVFGECPDEKWDHYLANYTANLPGRAGTFRPFLSFWDRYFGARAPSQPKEMADEEIKIISANTPQDIAFKLCKNKPPADVTVAFRNSPVYLKKGRSRFQARRKEAVKFDYAYSSDSNEEDDFMGNNVPRSKKARSVRIKSGLGEGGVPEYSDLEGVVVEIRHGQKPQDLEENWSPLFLRKHQHLSAETSLGSDRTDVPTPPVPLAAPATPTLLKASDRGSTQHAAFRSDARPQGPPPPKSNSADGLPKMRDVSKREEHQWDEFWKDVKDRAGG